MLEYDPSRTELSGRASSGADERRGADRTNYSAHPWTRVDTGEPARAGTDDDGNPRGPLADVRTSPSGAMEDCQTHGTIFI